MNDDAFDRYIDEILADNAEAKRLADEDNLRFQSAWREAEKQFDENPLENLEAFLVIVAQLYSNMETPDSAE
ncbi:MAG: hypothetical protein K8L97_33575 [Anaerolineae bacterium]|nr:hypothetical protein [Anaerolineae bacterium]